MTKRALLLAVVLTGCGETVSPSASTTVTYRAHITVPYSETVIYTAPRTGETTSCTRQLDLTGDISVTLPRSDPFINTDARLDLSLNGTGSSDEGLCGPNKTRQPLAAFIAQPSGSRSRFVLDVLRLEEHPTSPLNTTVQFTGSVSGDSAIGTLTFHRWRSGITDDDMPVTWQGITSVTLVLK